MTRHFSTSLSLVLFSAGSHLRAANKPGANGALEAKGIWTNDDFERLSDHRPISIVGHIAEEAAELASTLTPHIASGMRVMSVFQRHLLNPKEKEMMEIDSCGLAGRVTKRTRLRCYLSCGRKWVLAGGRLSLSLFRLPIFTLYPLASAQLSSARKSAIA
jgi:hypothetical protein